MFLGRFHRSFFSRFSTLSRPIYRLRSTIFIQHQRSHIAIMSPTTEQSSAALLKEDAMVKATQLNTQELIDRAAVDRDNLDIVKQLRADDNIVEYQAYSHSSPGEIEHSLTITTLRGPDKIIVPPLMFFNKSYTELTTVIHLGKKLCGHEGIIHGGLAATILDETLCYLGYPALAPSKVVFTANLNINYRKPIVSNQWVTIKAKLDKKEDHKAYISASIQNLDGLVLTEATCLLIAPKPKVATATASANNQDDTAVSSSASSQ